MNPEPDGGGAGGVPAEHWLRQPDAVAALTPSEGFCCTAFRVRLPQSDGATPGNPPSTAAGSTAFLRVLAEAPSWAALTARPSFFGNPLLFPFAYGVAGGTFEYRDQRYTLRPTRWGRVAHGLVRDHSWTVERTWSDADGDHIRATITTAGDAGMLAEFPFPFRLTATYSLSGTSLTLMAKATNLGPAPMPFGFGVHPYLPIPFSPDGELTEDVVSSNPDRLDAGGPPPAGAPITLAPATPPFDLRDGRTVAALLEAQGALRGAGGGLYVTYARGTDATGKTDTTEKDERTAGIRWSLTNRRRGLTVEIESGAECRGMVLFAPREPTTVISPVIGTCLPGFLDDAGRGRGLGLLELPPGETWSTRVVLRVRRDTPVSTPS